MTTFALVIALFTSGFAHTIDRAQPSPEYSAFLAAGGSLADICDAMGDGEGGGVLECEACRVIGSAVLPTVASELLLSGDQRAQKQRVVAEQWHRTRRLDHGCLSRAPPQA
ncbi:MAG: hypothetical protein AAGE38_12120 [Pseudomonadota bacterium]